MTPYIPNPLRCYNCQKFGHHESKCLKPPVCKKCGGSGSDHVEHTCTNPINCINCQGNHPADSRDCVVWKREREINQVKYSNNIPFPEARKIVQNQNKFPAKSYAQATSANTDTKHHSCHSCHTLLERIVSLTPDSLPKFINDIKVSLSESKQNQPSTSQPTIVQSKTTQPSREVVTQVTPPQKTQSPTSPVRQGNRSPNRGLRQSPTPRQRIQLEKTNSKNRFSALEDEESMEYGEIPSSPPSPTPKNVGQKHSQAPKPQRTKPHK